MRRVAITGNIGSGKSTITNYYKSLGYPTLDADHIVKTLYNDPKFIDSIAASLKTNLSDKLSHDERELLQELQPNKESIRNAVFHSATIRKYLEQLLHPKIQTESEDFFRKYKEAPFVFYEATLIFETNRANFFDAVILVTAPQADRRRRVAQRSGLDDGTINAIFASQMTSEEQRLHGQKHACFYEIANDSTTDQLLEHAGTILEQLRTRFQNT